MVRYTHALRFAVCAVLHQWALLCAAAAAVLMVSPGGGAGAGHGPVGSVSGYAGGNCDANQMRELGNGVGRGRPSAAAMSRAQAENEYQQRCKERAEAVEFDIDSMAPPDLVELCKAISVGNDTPKQFFYVMLLGFCSGMCTPGMQIGIPSMNWYEKPILYQVIVSASGSRKSQIFKLFATAIARMEEAHLRSPVPNPDGTREKQRVFFVQTATEEAFKEIIKTSGHLVFSSDELSTLWSNVIKRADGGSFRALWLELYNGLMLRSHTVGRGMDQSNCSNVAFIAMTQFGYFFRLVLSDNLCDGLWERFMFPVVRSHRHNLMSQREIPKHFPTVFHVLNAFFLICRKMNLQLRVGEAEEEDCCLLLSQEALVRFRAVAQHYLDSSDAERDDSIASLFSKSPGRILRVASILHILKYAMPYAQAMHNGRRTGISAEIPVPTIPRYVDVDTINYAYHYVKYCVDCRWAVRPSALAAAVYRLPQNIRDAMVRVLRALGELVSITEYNRLHMGGRKRAGKRGHGRKQQQAAAAAEEEEQLELENGVADAEFVFAHCELYGFGSARMVRARNGVDVLTFAKTKPSQLNAQHLQLFTLLGVELDAYTANYNFGSASSNSSASNAHSPDSSSDVHCTGWLQGRTGAGGGGGVQRDANGAVTLPPSTLDPMITPPGQQRPVPKYADQTLTDMQRRAAAEQWDHEQKRHAELTPPGYVVLDGAAFNGETPLPKHQRAAAAQERREKKAQQKAEAAAAKARNTGTANKRRTGKAASAAKAQAEEQSLAYSTQPAAQPLYDSPGTGSEASGGMSYMAAGAGSVPATTPAAAAATPNPTAATPYAGGPVTPVAMASLDTHSVASTNSATRTKRYTVDTPAIQRAATTAAPQAAATVAAVSTSATVVKPQAATLLLTPEQEREIAKKKQQAQQKLLRTQQKQQQQQQQSQQSQPAVAVVPSVSTGSANTGTFAGVPGATGAVKCHACVLCKVPYDPIGHLSCPSCHAVNPMSVRAADVPATMAAIDACRTDTAPATSGKLKAAGSARKAAARVPPSGSSTSSASATVIASAAVAATVSQTAPVRTASMTAASPVVATVIPASSMTGVMPAALPAVVPVPVAATAAVAIPSARATFMAAGLTSPPAATGMPVVFATPATVTAVAPATAGSTGRRTATAARSGKTSQRRVRGAKVATAVDGAAAVAVAGVVDSHPSFGLSQDSFPLSQFDAALYQSRYDSLVLQPLSLLLQAVTRLCSKMVDRHVSLCEPFMDPAQKELPGAVPCHCNRKAQLAKHQVLISPAALRMAVLANERVSAPTLAGVPPPSSLPGTVEQLVTGQQSTITDDLVQYCVELLRAAGLKLLRATLDCCLSALLFDAAVTHRSSVITESCLQPVCLQSRFHWVLLELKVTVTGNGAVQRECIVHDPKLPHYVIEHFQSTQDASVAAIARSMPVSASRMTRAQAAAQAAAATTATTTTAAAAAPLSPARVSRSAATGAASPRTPLRAAAAAHGAYYDEIYSIILNLFGADVAQHHSQYNLQAPQQAADNGVDCGLYVIAMMTALAHGFDINVLQLEFLSASNVVDVHYGHQPSGVSEDLLSFNRYVYCHRGKQLVVDFMRAHLLECIRAQHMLPFPLANHDTVDKQLHTAGMVARWNNDKCQPCMDRVNQQLAAEQQQNGKKRPGKVRNNAADGNTGTAARKRGGRKAKADTVMSEPAAVTAAMTAAPDGSASFYRSDSMEISFGARPSNLAAPIGVIAVGADSGVTVAATGKGRGGKVRQPRKSRAKKEKRVGQQKLSDAAAIGAGGGMDLEADEDDMSDEHEQYDDSAFAGVQAAMAQAEKAELEFEHHQERLLRLKLQEQAVTERARGARNALAAALSRDLTTPAEASLSSADVAASTMHSSQEASDVLMHEETADGDDAAQAEAVAAAAGAEDEELESESDVDDPDAVAAYTEAEERAARRRVPKYAGCALVDVETAEDRRAEAEIEGDEDSAEEGFLVSDSQSLGYYGTSQETPVTPSSDTQQQQTSQQWESEQEHEQQCTPPPSATRIAQPRIDQFFPRTPVKQPAADSKRTARAKVQPLYPQQLRNAAATAAATDADMAISPLSQQQRRQPAQQSQPLQHRQPLSPSPSDAAAAAQDAMHISGCNPSQDSSVQLQRRARHKKSRKLLEQDSPYPNSASQSSARTGGSKRAAPVDQTLELTATGDAVIAHGGSGSSGTSGSGGSSRSSGSAQSATSTGSRARRSLGSVLAGTPSSADLSAEKSRGVHDSAIMVLAPLALPLSPIAALQSRAGAAKADGSPVKKPARKKLRKACELVHLSDEPTATATAASHDADTHTESGLASKESLQQLHAARRHRQTQLAQFASKQAVLEHQQRLKQQFDHRAYQQSQAPAAVYQRFFNQPLQERATTAIAAAAAAASQVQPSARSSVGTSAAHLSAEYDTDDSSDCSGSKENRTRVTLCATLQQPRSAVPSAGTATNTAAVAFQRASSGVSQPDFALTQAYAPLRESNEQREALRSAGATAGTAGKRKPSTAKLRIS